MQIETVTIIINIHNSAHILIANCVKFFKDGLAVAVSAVGRMSCAKFVHVSFITLSDLLRFCALHLWPAHERTTRTAVYNNRLGGQSITAECSHDPTSAFCPKQRVATTWPMAALSLRHPLFMFLLIFTAFPTPNVPIEIRGEQFEVTNVQGQTDNHPEVRPYARVYKHFVSPARGTWSVSCVRRLGGVSLPVEFSRRGGYLGRCIWRRGRGSSTWCGGRRAPCHRGVGSLAKGGVALSAFSPGRRGWVSAPRIGGRFVCCTRPLSRPSRRLFRAGRPPGLPF